VRYKFIFEHRNQWLLQVMLRVLQVSESGYRYWLNKPNCPRHDEDAHYQLMIRSIFDASRQTYGSPRIHKDLRELGHRISRKRVARLMREMGLTPIQKRRTTRTTFSDPRGWYAPNILARDFSAARPNLKWVGDITYIDTKEGWLYLATVIDLFSRRVVGWAFGNSIDAHLVCKAFKMAVQQRQPQITEGVRPVFHSDRGSQYASRDFRSLLQANGFQQSMSAKGDCYDNAVAESFFHTLKIDLVHRRIYESAAEARQDIFSYIEGFYNVHRRHSTIAYCSPEEWEQRHAA